MREQIRQDRMVVQFSGARAGTAPLTWGQKAILQDIRDNDDQFTMFGTVLTPGCSVDQVLSWVSALIHRHAALRMRLARDEAGHLCQEVAAAGEIEVAVRSLPDNTDQVDLARYLEDLFVSWPRVPFDFERDWPLRLVALTQRGDCRALVYVLSHLAGDGVANMSMLVELTQVAARGAAFGDQRPPQVLDLARSQAQPQLRQLSRRTMSYWESALRSIPALTFGAPAHGAERDGHRYWQLKLSSPAADLAIQAIAKRTGTDISRVTLAVIATAVGRATGVHPLPMNVMMSNRFRPGLADVFAPIAQNTVVTIDVADASIDEVVGRTRAATLTAGLRAYYDPDDLAELVERLDEERGYPARVTCRFNDQRSAGRRPAGDVALADLTPKGLKARLAQTSLSWYCPLDQLFDQVSMVILTRTRVLTLYLKCDLWCLPPAQAEALLRCIEEVAVEAAFDPAAPSRVGAVGGR